MISISILHDLNRALWTIVCTYVLVELIYTLLPDFHRFDIFSLNLFDALNDVINRHLKLVVVKSDKLAASIAKDSEYAAQTVSHDLP